MPRFNVTVEKSLLQSGVIEVEAENGNAAQAKVQTMMENPQKPLNTNDSRIEWDEPEYEDFSFKVTGDVDEV